ncbi:uncharacterized protein LOC114240489 [Bombyx mandarina]|uniref:Uncharacterized protein n=2 Tax=Bombyx TaxID=7090 RepID=A0A8R2DPX4_BOMMO|nr:uncharacterized protein LOC101738693 [Bombyx mori]XP_028026856.1 uncharacterized protein LOC114240489 [Bombyx mandarina]
MTWNKWKKVSRMGSLPDLTERSRPAPRIAVRTVSDPHRNRTIITQIPVNAIYKKDWPWRKSKTPIRVGPAVSARRRESAASSLGAASVRRLLARPPQKLPRTLVHRFTLLCISSGLCATALHPFTAFAGAEAGSLPLAIMHSIAAITAPFAPLILQKTGNRIVITVAHILVFILLTAHTVATPLSVLLFLYALCGLSLSPMSLALAASANSLAQAAGDESRRKIALRRALRALRAAHDLGLVFGSLLLGAALIIWPENVTQQTDAPLNMTLSQWSSPVDDYFLEDNYEETTCGAAGCPDTQSTIGIVLNADGRRVLVAVWAFVSLSSIGLGVYGAPSSPAPPPDARSIFRDPRALLGAPMGLFIGLQQGFIYTSYIKWYGVCVDGWWCAWRALVGAGAFQALAAGTLSMAAARGRRGALVAGGGAAHASLVLALLRWRAARTDLALPALAAAAWGACSALWDVLQGGLCIGGPGWRGPWSVVLCARHTGLALACAARHSLCVRTQLPALAAALAAALASHTALEIRMRKGEANRHRS